MKGWLLFLPLLLCGCVNISGTRTAPDGTQLTIRADRFLWMSSDVKFSTTDESGLAVELSVGNSRPDVEAIKALATLAGQAAKGAVAP